MPFWDIGDLWELGHLIKLQWTFTWLSLIWQTWFFWLMKTLVTPYPEPYQTTTGIKTFVVWKYPLKDMQCPITTGHVRLSSKTLLVPIHRHVYRCTFQNSIEGNIQQTFLFSFQGFLRSKYDSRGSVNIKKPSSFQCCLGLKNKWANT